MLRQLSQRLYIGFLDRELMPYFKHARKKSWMQQFRELIHLTRKYKFPPYQYFNVGLYEDTVDDDITNFLPPVFISEYRDQLNSEEGCRFINDKHTFAKVMKEGDVTVVQELFVIDCDGAVVAPDGRVLDHSMAAAIVADHGKDTFVKPLSGRFGLGASVVTTEGFNDFLASDPRDVIVQPRLIQHDTLAALHPSSVNTVRIDTLRVEGGWIHNAAVLRIGRGGSVVDNGLQRGLFVGVDLETGALHPLARGRSQFGTGRMLSHPDTGIIFNGHYVPYWEDVLATVCAGANILFKHGLQSIGWDVAILPEGPCIIEANAGWNVSIMQVGYGLAGTEIGRRALSRRRIGHRVNLTG